MHRPIVSEYGMWDQLRVDHGKEWMLMLYAQELLANFRYNTSRPPHLQTTSKRVCILFITYLKHCHEFKSLYEILSRNSH